MHSPPSPAVSEVQIQLWPLHFSSASGHETTDHANGAIHSKGTPQMCNYLTSSRLISPAKRLGKQGRQNSVAFQQYHYMSEFSQTSLENIYLTCSVTHRCIPQECHPSICLVLIYHLDKSRNSFPRIKFSQMPSSVESKKVSGKCYNTEGKVLTTVVFPEAGGPRTQTLGATEQGHANVKMQNSKNPN